MIDRSTKSFSPEETYLYGAHVIYRNWFILHLGLIKAIFFHLFKFTQKHLSSTIQLQKNKRNITVENINKEAQ